MSGGLITLDSVVLENPNSEPDPICGPGVVDSVARPSISIANLPTGSTLRLNLIRLPLSPENLACTNFSSENVLLRFVTAPEILKRVVISGGLDHVASAAPPNP